MNQTMANKIKIESLNLRIDYLHYIYCSVRYKVIYPIKHDINCLRSLIVSISLGFITILYFSEKSHTFNINHLSYYPFYG